MKIQAAKWGNSTAVRLPKSVARELGIAPGSQLDIVVEGREVRLRPVRKTSRELLEEMIAEAKRLGLENEPEAVDWGPDRGSEIIDDDDPR
jgi:antitoxin MazE